MANYNELHFSYNWNGKLSFSRYFTTIRLHNEEKYRQGNVLEVYQGPRRMADAEVVARKTFLLKDMNAFMAGIDTGYSLAEAKAIIRKMYHNVKPSPDQVRYDFVLLRWKEEPLKQTTLL